MIGALLSIAAATALILALPDARTLRMAVVLAELGTLGLCADRLNHITRNVSDAREAGAPDTFDAGAYTALRRADAYARPYIVVVIAIGVSLGGLTLRARRVPRRPPGT